MFRSLSLVLLAALFPTMAALADEPTGVQREVYFLKQSSANQLADLLAKLYKGEPGVQIMAGPSGNCLVVAGPAPTMGEIRKLVEQLDRPTQLLALEVLIVDLPLPKKGADVKEIDTRELAGKLDDVQNRLQALQKKGEVAGVRRFQMLTAENTPARAQITENRPFVVGSHVTATGIVSSNISYRETGTTVSILPQVQSGDMITLEVDVKDSHMHAPEDGVVLGPAEKGGKATAAEFVNTALSTRLTVSSGQVVVARGMQTDVKAPQGRTLVLVGASLSPAAKPK
jgi:type II secretory pathway component GspD/PulD (secretin)